MTQLNPDQRVKFKLSFIFKLFLQLIEEIGIIKLYIIFYFVYFVFVF